MKHFFLAAVALFLLVSCKEQTGEVVLNANESIGKLPLTLDNSKAEAMKQLWDAELAATGTSSEIESLEIIELNAKAGNGDATVKTISFYALKAVTKDRQTTLTALLMVRDKEFYLDQETPTMICTGNCTAPCEPGATYKNGKIWLECSGCADCVKTDFML